MLMVCGASVTWSFVTPGIVMYSIVMNSTVAVVSAAISRGASVGVGAEKVVLSARAEVPVSKTAARMVKRMSNIVAIKPQQTR